MRRPVTGDEFLDDPGEGRIRGDLAGESMPQVEVLEGTFQEVAFLGSSTEGDESGERPVHAYVAACHMR